MNTISKQIVGVSPSALFAATVTMAWGLSSAPVFAAATASDTAANYAGIWSTTPANLGSGFGPWNITPVNNDGPPYAGTYLDQTSYNNSDGVLTSGFAWATYANGGSGNGALDMVRPFTAGPSGSTSLYDQTFSVDIGTSGVGGSGSSMDVGIGSAFTLSYVGGGSDSLLLSVDGGAATPLTVDWANINAGLQISLAVSGALNSPNESYTLTLSPASGGADYDLVSGSFDSSAFNTSSFSFADNNTSGDEFVNDLSISAESVPEPSTLVLGASGLAALRLLRRRG